MKRFSGSPTSRSNYAADVLLNVCLVDVEPYSELFDCIAARERLIVTGMRLANYRIEHGHYPDKLADLPATSLRDVSIDPCTGAGFHYVRRNNGYELYSIGQNLRDDHGLNADHDDSALPDADDLNFSLLQ